MSAEPTTVEPDEVSKRQGMPTARFGQAPGVPYDEWIDPIPSVYASGWNGGEIDLPDMRLSLDHAEQYAERILNAVRYQRAEAAKERAAELNAMARGNAATHTWGVNDTGTARCTQCRTLVYTDKTLQNGAVPPCGDRCPLSWHAIVSTFRNEPGDAKCIHCHTVYPSTVESEVSS